MFNEKEILEIVDNIDINEDEFNYIDVELSDIEKKKIQNQYKKKIKTNKWSLYKKGIIACGLALTLYVGTIASIPVNASNIPVLNSIYESLGVYDEYKDYSTYVGESQKIGKYTYTIEEMVVSIHKSVVAIKIESDDNFLEDHEGFMINSKIGGVSWDSSTSQNHRIDDKTIITTIEHFYSERIPNKSDVNIIIHSIDYREINDSTIAEFDFKADFKKSYTESFERNINGVLFKENSAILIDEFNSSIFGSNIVTKSMSLNNNIDSHRNYDLIYVVSVDGKQYIAEVTNSSWGRSFILPKGYSVAEIQDLKVDEINNAKSISLVVYEPKNSDVEIVDHEMSEEYLKEYMDSIKTYKIK